MRAWCDLSPPGFGGDAGIALGRDGFYMTSKVTGKGSVTVADRGRSRRARLACWSKHCIHHESILNIETK